MVHHADLHFSNSTLQQVNDPTNDGQMQRHTQPEHNPIAELLRLVPKDSLSQQRTRPSAKQCNEVQGLLGHSAAILSSTALAESVENEGTKTQDATTAR